MASGSKLNEEKTEILKLGPAMTTSDKEFNDKLKDSIKILGTYFHPDENEEQRMNLEKAILKTIRYQTQDNYSSLMGRILKINTYIYSTLWHKAFIINETHKEFNRLIHEIGIYLNPIIGSSTYQQVIKEKENGGLGLINLKERIKAIKTYLIINSFNNLPEADDLMYYFGTRVQKVYGTAIGGRNCSDRKSKWEKYLKLIYAEIDNINFTTKTKPKDIELKIKKERQEIIHKHLFYSKDPKLISINYAIAYSILEVRTYERCIFCKSESETIEHLFTQCNKLLNIRNKITKLLQPIEPVNFHRIQILYMENQTNLITHIVISTYKQMIWKSRNMIRKFKIKNIDYDKIWEKLDENILFRLHQL